MKLNRRDLLKTFGIGVAEEDDEPDWSIVRPYIGPVDPASVILLTTMSPPYKLEPYRMTADEAEALDDLYTWYDYHGNDNE